MEELFRHGDHMIFLNSPGSKDLITPNEPSGGPCQVQTTCPSPAPGVLGRVIGCWGDFYCLKSTASWVECDYSRQYC